MHKRILHTLICVGLVLLTAGSVSAAADTTDREKIIDVAELTKAIHEATEPVFSRMRSNDLNQRFEQVQQLLAAEQVDKEQLVQSLRELRREITEFTADWDSITAPLWEGQEALGETIDKVRGLLAAGQDGSADPKRAKLLKGYDKRLELLARQIEAEQDPVRRKRLKSVFANILTLRTLAERLGGINLGPASEALQVRIVQALSSLQDQLTQATFEVEKVRVVLDCESQFISNYIDVVEGMIEAEQLAKILGQMQTEGSSFEGVNIDISQLQDSAGQFAQTMNDFAGRLAESIETETTRFADDLASRADMDDADVEAAIRRYAGTDLAASNVAGQ